MEAAVIALNDMRRGMVVWLERRGYTDIELAIGGAFCLDSRCFVTEQCIGRALKEAEYNMTWRAWSAEPTEEQRRAAAWDD